MGCFRSLDEIQQWGSASELSKRQTLQQAKIRQNNYRMEQQHPAPDETD